MGRKPQSHKDASILCIDCTITEGRDPKKADTKQSLGIMITVIRLHLIIYEELLAFIKDTYKVWRKTHNASFAFAAKKGAATPKFETI